MRDIRSQISNLIEQENWKSKTFSTYNLMRCWEAICIWWNTGQQWAECFHQDALQNSKGWKTLQATGYFPIIWFKFVSDTVYICVYIWHRSLYTFMLWAGKYYQRTLWEGISHPYHTTPTDVVLMVLVLSPCVERLIFIIFKYLNDNGSTYTATKFTPICNIKKS